MRGVIAVVLAVLCNASLAAEQGMKLIWDNIPFIKGGNYYEFDDEFSKARSTARSESLGELASLLMPLAWSTDDMARLTRTLATTLLQFDDLVRRHAQDVHEGISVSLADDFKAGVDRFYQERRLNDNEQVSGLASVSREDLQAMSQNQIPITQALRLVRGLRFLAYGSYTVLGHGKVRVALSLQDLITLRVRSFSVDGPLEQVGQMLAGTVIDFLQSMEYPTWENPHPQLTWIAPADPQHKTSAQLAARYCESQNARLPYTSELLAAATGGNYRKGGIGPLFNNSTYIVADRNRYDAQYYYSTGELAQTQTGGPIHTSAGHGAITGYYWCVRGEPSKATLFDQAVYRLLRQNGSQQRAKVVLALEYVLAKRNDLGTEAPNGGLARLSEQDGFDSLESAVQFLAHNGVFLQLP
jgi:hypothetical protein